MLRSTVLALCLAVAGCAQEAPLYSTLEEGQANRVKATLLTHGIAAQKVRAESNRWAVHVPTGDVPRAMEVLHANGLPERGHKTMGELFRKEGFVSSPTEQRARYLFALTQELESTLSAIDGVIDARVHLALPEKKPLEQDAEAGSASVVLIHRPGSGLEQRETSIRAIVTDGLERITDPNRVTVQMFERALAEPAPTPDPAPDTSRQALLVAGGGVAGALLVASVLGGAVWYRRRNRAAPEAGASAAEDDPETPA